MKTPMVIILASIVLLASPLKLFAEDSTGTLNASEKAFVEKLVKAINEKSEEQLKALMHPSCRACMNEKNKDYYNDIFQKSFERPIPEKYTATIRLFLDEERKTIQQNIEIHKKLGIDYPVKSTHILQIDFKVENSPYTQAVVVKYLAKEGDDFYWVEACPSVQWMEDYRKRKGNKEEEAKYWERFIALGWEYEKSLPLSERRNFAKDEYGALFWSEETYQNVWYFRTDAVFRDIKIVLIDSGGEEKVLVENKTLQGFVPLVFRFFLGEAKAEQNGLQTEIRATYGFSRSGERPVGQSGGLTFKGTEVKKIYINKILSAKDILHASRNSILATIETQDHEKTFNYIIQLQVQAKGSYFLEYGYENREGKLTAYLTNGESKFFTWASLKEWVAKLPAGTKVEFFSTCMQERDQPFFDAKELENFKNFCLKHKIDYIFYPAG